MVAGVVVPVRMLPLERLERAEWNANRVPPKTLEKIKASIAEFGFVENLVGRPHPGRDGQIEILSGNHRLELARELGITELPVVVVDVDDAHARILAQTLNRTRGADDAAAYAALLEKVLAEMSRERVLSFLPETDASLERALARIRKPTDDPDHAPGAPATAESKPGEVYELGKHRLICGDATDLETYAQLLGDERAQLVLTDPPYNVDYHGKAGSIANDAMPDDRFRAFLVDAFAGAAAYSTAGSPIYIWHADAQGSPFRDAMRDTGWLHKQTLIWVKSSLVLGRQDYQWKHEPCLYGWKAGAAHRWYGGFAETTVIDDDVDVRKLGKRELLALVDELRNAAATTVMRAPKPSSSDLHPTMKPVALLERMIWNSSERGEIVLDPFLGSGSTLIAAERTDRRCYGAELDPRFCDVIRQRYAEHAATAAVRDTSPRSPGDTSPEYSDDE